jgi:hypothetical protein
MATNGLQGVNFHGGGRSPYSPLNDNGSNITIVNSEFYGLKMLSLMAPGNVVSASLAMTSNVNFTAYGVRQSNGPISVLLNNKDTNNTVSVSVNLGSYVTSAQLIAMTAPALSSTNNFMLGGAPISTNGSWTGGVQAVLSATNGQLTVNVPPISAVLLNPVVASPAIAFSASGNQLILNWPTNYTGWLLQSNSVGAANNSWYNVPGSTNTNRWSVTVQSGQTNVYYRLLFP